MENKRVIKFIVYILSRGQKFTDKYTAESDLTSAIVIILQPLMLNILGLLALINDDYLLTKELLIAFIPIVSIIVIAGISLGIYLDKKDRYLSIKEKITSDKYFIPLIKKKKLIDVLLVVNGVFWIVTFAVIYFNK